MARKKEPGDSQTRGEAALARPYVVLARKYRPQTFADLIGQDAMVQTLANAFKTGRIAQGYMLTGVRGVGKTTTARILARAFNYETDTVHAPSVDMPVLGRHCVEIMESRHPDVLEMDAASNTSVDNVREIIENARYRPISARTKVFIVDEVHMLSKNAFNALLKTLEEPPEHVKFIFATTEIRKVPVTVLSRCQRFDLRRVDVPVLARHFAKIVDAEGVTAEPDALALIARAAGGSVRDGLSILDQAIAMGAGAVTAGAVRDMLGLADRGRVFDLATDLFAGRTPEALAALAALHGDGADPIDILADLATVVHTTARVRVAGAGAAGEDLAPEERRRAEALAVGLSPAILSRAWQMLVKGLEEAQRAPDPLAAADMVLIRIAYAADLPSPDDVLRRLGGEPTRGEIAGSAPKPVDPPRRAPLNKIASTPVSDREPDTPRFEDMEPASEPIDVEYEDEVVLGATAPVALADPRSFHDIVKLAAARREAKLKFQLEEHVSLVKFDATQAQIELHLLVAAPKEIANTLREKLNLWTGRKWMIALARQPGALPIAEVERQRAAAERAELEKHPAVREVLGAFPDAKITKVLPLARAPEDETGTG
jgi:DNA polymerase-3 subunit gamma/tau